MVIAGTSVPTLLADPIASYDFNYEAKEEFASQFNVLNNNNDTNKWEWYKYTTSTPGYYYARVYGYGGASYDDYMTTKTAVALEAGHAYCVEFQGWTDDSSYDSTKTPMGTLELGYGTGDDVTAYTMFSSFSMPNINKYTNETPQTFKGYFTVPTSGNYYLTFHATGSYSSCVDNIVITDAGSPDKPMPATDVTVTPGENFALTANVTYTLPTKTIIGTDLTSLSKVQIYNGDRFVAQDVFNFTPGTTRSVQDNNAVAGEQTYTVYVFNGDEKSEAASASAYIGPLTPKPVTNLKVTPSSEEADTYVISWTAPTKSVNEMDLDASMLKYDVYRVIDGNESKIAMLLTEASFTDTYTAETRVSVAYKVVARYGTMSSEGTTSAPFKLGAMNLPFADSFAGNVLSDDWTAEIISGTYNWETQSSGSSPYASPQDGDGGMVYYKSYSSRSGNGARLITPEFINAAESNPAIEFWFYHYTRGNDQIAIEVQKDGGEWEQVDGTLITLESNSEGWSKYSFSLTNAVAGSQKYRVAIRAISAYGYNLYVDNVRVFNRLAHDLQTTITGPETIIAGNEATYTITVTNNGMDVAANDYSLMVWVDETLVDNAPASVDIAAGASQTFEYKFKFNSGYAYSNEESVEVEAAIDYDADMDDTNDMSAAATVVTLLENPTAQNLIGVVNGDNIDLTWDPAVDTNGYTPTSIDEDFANAANDENGETFVYCGWTAIDRDQSETGTLYGYKSSIWKVFDVDNSYAPRAQSGKWLAVLPPKTGVSDDWLISPELNSFDKCNFKVTFTALAQETGTGSKMSVAYSTTDNQPESFIELEPITLHTGKTWYNYEAIVPGTAKYVAIHNVSNASSSNILGIDRIKVESTLPLVLGYNVYEDTWKQLNSELVTETSFTLPKEKDNTTREGEQQRSFSVSTVYAEGETAQCDPAVVSIESGVDEINANIPELKMVAGGIQTSAAALVYSLDGCKVASADRAAVISLAPGIYLVRTGDVTYKVAVR